MHVVYRWQQSSNAGRPTATVLSTSRRRANRRIPVGCHTSRLPSLSCKPRYAKRLASTQPKSRPSKSSAWMHPSQSHRPAGPIAMLAAPARSCVMRHANSHPAASALIGAVVRAAALAHHAARLSSFFCPTKSVERYGAQALYP